MRQARARHNRIRDVIKVETRVFLLLCRTCNLPVFETPIRYTFMYSNNGYLIVILLTPLLSSRQSIVLLKYVFCFSRWILHRKVRASNGTNIDKTFSRTDQPVTIEKLSHQDSMCSTLGRFRAHSIMGRAEQYSGWP